MIQTRKTRQVLTDDIPNTSRSSPNDEINEDLSQKCLIHDCKDSFTITDNVSGEIICGACGFVLVEKSVDPNPELMSDALEFVRKTRTGPEQSLAMYDMGMMTIISDKDAMGHSLSSNMKDTFGRLKILNNRSRVAGSNRTLRSALLLLDSLKTKLGLPDSVAENAAYIYRKSMLKKITIGRSAKSLMCASIYVACRQSQIPRSLLDISQAAGLSKKEVSRACRSLIEKFEISLEPCDASEFLTKIANEANITEKTRRSALKILAVISEKGTSAGKNPMALAAATLYMACILNGEKKTQHEMAKAAGITAVTIRNRYSTLRKEIRLELEQIIDSNS